MIKAAHRHTENWAIAVSVALAGDLN